MLDVKKLLTKILARVMLVSTEHTVSTNVSVTSGKSSNNTYTATKSGYYPIGVIGWRLANGSGSGGSYGCAFGVNMTQASLGSATVRVGLRAVDGNVNGCTLFVTILWQKR